MSSDFTDLLKDKLADFKNKRISDRTFYGADRKNKQSFRKKCGRIYLYFIYRISKCLENTFQFYVYAPLLL